MSDRRAVVIYDGQCGNCVQMVERLKGQDSERILDFLDLHDPDLPSAQPAIDLRRARQRIQLLRPDGGPPLEGYDAVRWIAERLPSTRRWAILLRIPGATWIGRRLYDEVARRRR